MDAHSPHSKAHPHLDKAYEALARHCPEWFLRWLHGLRRPGVRLARLAAGLVLLVLGVLGPVLPVAGLWMIPIGLLLIAEDVPAMQVWVVAMILWLEVKWMKLRDWWRSWFPRK